MDSVKRDNTIPTSGLFLFARKHWYASIKSVVLYIILYFCTASFNLGSWIYIVISALCFLAFVYFDYTAIWQLALRDHNLVKSKYIEYDKLKGLKAGLIASAPGLLVCILILVLRSASTTYSDFVKLFHFILYPYFSIVVGALKQSAVIYFAPLILPPVISLVAYRCGYDNIGILMRLVYKNGYDRSKNKKLR